MYIIILYVYMFVNMYAFWTYLLIWELKLHIGIWTTIHSKNICTKLTSIRNISLLQCPKICNPILISISYKQCSVARSRIKSLYVSGFNTHPQRCLLLINELFFKLTISFHKWPNYTQVYPFFFIHYKYCMSSEH